MLLFFFFLLLFFQFYAGFFFALNFCFGIYIILSFCSDLCDIFCSRLLMLRSFFCFCSVLFYLNFFIWTCLSNLFLLRPFYILTIKLFCFVEELRFFLESALKTGLQLISQLHNISQSVFFVHIYSPLVQGPFPLLARVEVELTQELELDSIPDRPSKEIFQNKLYSQSQCCKVKSYVNSEKTQSSLVPLRLTKSSTVHSISYGNQNIFL